MARKCMTRREKRRTRLSKNGAEKRAALVASLKKRDASMTLEDKFALLAQLESMPRDSSQVRRTRRCALTGRAHGVYRKFGLARNELRRLALEGFIPGLVKASW